MKIVLIQKKGYGQTVEMACHHARRMVSQGRGVTPENFEKIQKLARVSVNGEDQGPGTVESVPAPEDTGLPPIEEHKDEERESVPAPEGEVENTMATPPVETEHAIVRPLRMRRKKKR